MIYTLIETGLCIAEVASIDLAGLDDKTRRMEAIEKGGVRASCQISNENLQASRDYITHKRDADAAVMRSPPG